MKNQIGLLEAISTLIGTMIGAAIFVLLGPLASQTGNSLMLAFFIGSIPAFLASIYYIQLSSITPTTGGSFVYAKNFLNPTSGFIVGCFMVFAGVGAVGMLALGLVDYLSFYFDNLNVLLIACSVIVLFLIINSFGIGFAAKIQVVMVLWILVSLVLFIGTGLWAYSTGKLVATQSTPFLLNGSSGLLMASVLAFYSYAGYGLITEIGGKIKNAKRNAPLSILISLVIVTVLYVLVAFTCLKLVNVEQFVTFTASLPMTAQLFLPNWMVNFIAIGGIMAIVTTMNAVLFIIPEEITIMAVHKYIPKRFESPKSSLLVVGLISIILVVCGINATIFSTMTVVGLLISSIFMGLSMLMVFKKQPSLYENASLKLPKPLIYICCILGIITSALFILLAVIDALVVAGLSIALVVLCLIYTKISGIKSINLVEGENSL